MAWTKLRDVSISDPGEIVRAGVLCGLRARIRRGELSNADNVNKRATPSVDYVFHNGRVGHEISVEMPVTRRRPGTNRARTVPATTCLPLATKGVHPFR